MAEAIGTIYRGTTPTVTVRVTGLDLSDAALWPVVWLSARNRTDAIDVARDGLAIAAIDGGCTVAATLTQDQTLALTAQVPLQLQVRAKDSGGDAVALPVAQLAVEDVLKGGDI